MLSVIGGLAVMLGSSPLAAQTSSSATRSFDSETVVPGGTVTVTISAIYGGIGGVTETLPSDFTYVDDSLVDLEETADNPPTVSLSEDRTDSAQGILAFNLLGTRSFTYQVTAPDAEDTYTFSGMLTARGQDYTVEGDTIIMVSTETGPAPVDAGDLQFDVVPAKAVKGAVVSGLNYPIGSNPLQWDVSDVATGTLVSIANDGIVGDFQVKDAGSGIFRLEVMTSGAPSLSGSQSINVALSYDDDTTVNLTGDINEQDALTFTNSPFDFTISQAITAGTPIGAFDVDGDVAGEYLDGIVSGDDSGPFEVRDSDMTLVIRAVLLRLRHITST